MVSCGVGHRHGSDPVLLWLWCRLAAVAPIRPLAWEPPYAESVALRKKGLHQFFPKIILILKLTLFYCLCYFFGLLLRHMEVPRLGVELEL